MIETKTELDAELREETKAVIAKLTTGTPIPPEISARIRERGAKARAENLRLFGIQNTDDFIREMRDEA